MASTPPGDKIMPDLLGALAALDLELSDGGELRPAIA